MTVQWGEITVEEIAGQVDGKLVSGLSGTPVGGVSTDSRSIKTGDLFIALTGKNFDAHEFVNNAIEKGASCAIVGRDRYFDNNGSAGTAVIEVADTLKALGDLAMWWKRQFEVSTVSITGSMGKTTTKEMVAAILEQEGETLRSKGNFNNLIGLPLTLLQLNGKHRYAVLEMGMNRPGEIGRLTGISNPDIGIITNVGKVHLEGVGSLDGVARAKTEMVEIINKDSKVILNGDDELLMKSAGRFNRRKYTFGVGRHNNFRADSIEDLGRDGSSFVIRYEGGSLPAQIKVPGYHNVMNALAASSAALCMGVSEDKIAEGLNRYKGTKGRLVPVDITDNITLLDDTYNSNPSSLKAVLQTLKKMAGDNRRIIVALGEMLELGEYTEEAHFEAGEMVAETGVSYFMVMGDHAQQMLKGAVEKGFSSESMSEVKTHDEMTKKIRDVMGNNSLILIKGSRGAGLDRVVRNLLEE